MQGTTWNSETPPTIPKPSWTGWARAVCRGIPIAMLVFGGLAVLLVLRMAEAPLHGVRRPWTPHVTVFVCRHALLLMGLRPIVRGHRMKRDGAVVANHSSWLDIFALNAHDRVYFVSKSEVAAWPGIGWLARATGTVFINRDRREAGVQREIFEQRLGVGHKLLFFPEGTSTDGQRVLPFKPTLFAAFFSDRLRDKMWVQPVSVVYQAPDGTDPRFYGWWGDMEFGPHLVAVLAQSPQGRVEVIWHEPIKVSDYPDRKALAKATEESVAVAHASARREKPTARTT